MNPLSEKLDQILPGRSRVWSEFKGQAKVTIAARDLLTTMQAVRDKLNFNMLVDVTAVDWLEYEGAKDRFEVVYCLLDVDSGERLIVSVMLNEPDLQLDSVYPVWKSADWLEREVYDMFGITFKGHPNFKRLLLPDLFTSFPLRKDYPVRGRGERHNFPVITRAES
jgi:NADH-quinone oxidoreductase subunit C